MSTIQIYSAFANLLEATQKKVLIKIDEDELTKLKNNGYKLCFAKKVGEEDFNVVWQSYDSYLANNEFSWTPQYQIFGSNTFEEKIKVKVSTNPIFIQLGQTTTLNEVGIFQKAVSGGDKNALNVINKFGDIHVGVSQLSTGIDGQMISTPIYVSTKVVIRDDDPKTPGINLKPKEEVLVWFEQNIETSTIFSGVRGKAIPIDLTNSSEEARLFKGDEWLTI
jgi:hypothetical protein